MARSTPGTAGSKGGGSVIPSNQMRIGGGPQRIFNPRFGGRGGSSGFMAGANTYGRRSPISTPPFRRPPPFMPSPFRRPPPIRYPRPYMPRPQNRYLPSILPRQRSPFSPPPNRYGGVGGPSGLAGFLANQPAIRQIEIDPATGFRTQNQIEKDAAEAASQAERDRIAQEAEDARQPEGEKTDYQKMKEGIYVPDERARNLGYTGERIARYQRNLTEEQKNPSSFLPASRRISEYSLADTLSSPDAIIEYPSSTYNVTPPSGQVVESIAPVKMERLGGLPQPLTRDELDARFATMQAQRAAQGVDPTRSSGKGGSKGGASTVPAGSQTRQGMGGVSKGGGMGGTSMPSYRTSPIRPAMGARMATGGPVGIASLAGRY